MQHVSASCEDYLEAILELTGYNNNSIRSVDIAKKLGVSRASVNRAVGVLKDSGYVTQERYSALFLTGKGKEQALSVRNRHLVLRSFLKDILGVDDFIAEQDACKMEHTISEETMSKLEHFMKDKINS